MAQQHNGNWGQTLVETLRKQGVSDQALVGNSGLHLQNLDGDEPRISFSDLALLFERAAEVTNDDLIGFKHGQSSDYRRGGLFTYTGVTSPTVGAMLTNLGRYQRITGDALELDTGALETKGILDWRFSVPQDIKRKQYVEFSTTLLVHILRRLTDRRLTPVEVRLRHFRKSNIEKMSSFFGCPIVFGAKQNGITFKTSDLDLPLTSADDRLYIILKMYCEDRLKRLGNKQPSIVVKVEQCISSDLTKSQDEVAADLGMSPRTLSRRLNDSGTTFFGVVEAHREAMAKSMLSDSNFQITEIAFVLGYSDPSSFSTAFRRWTNKTPSQFRDQHSK